MTSSQPCSTSADDDGALARQRAKAQGKTLFASARKLIPQVIGEAFAEAHRRDPGNVRPILAIVDGNKREIARATTPQRALLPAASDRVSEGGRNGSVRRQSEDG